MSSTIILPSTNLLGNGCLTQAIDIIEQQGFKKALIVTDAVLNKIGVVAQITNLLAERDISFAVYDGTQPNPTIDNVEQGLSHLVDNDCDLIISVGGGSPHDCAKGVALVATNGGKIQDYEGINQAAQAPFPLISINTTAGTASEMTMFSVITDEARQIKMAIVDQKVTPLISVNDPQLMLAMPKSLTAATGMDALTHAIEAYVSTAANPITNTVALKAIEMIHTNLPLCIENGENLEAREQMAYAQFMAGMAFNNALLGYVHAMAHQLGATYHLPHGICNAVLLPHVQRFNYTACPEKFRDIAVAMGRDVSGMAAEEAALCAIDAMADLASLVGIPANLTEIGVKSADISALAESTLTDVCCMTNPKQASKEEIMAIFETAM
ncbi:iron-containing alcohol dehydrogenase [Vibrio methylphosphonaticus]|uniref:iron-containing alcohol dehydrogenase n=1 Tax=Vibrio methylphosphonaticus TaxID=2946866 RepID=UPI00202AA5BF|nr:iron-containing alcohol dehydrogenase [Vibrio methylphosphonaticus]MCL9775764.1 iron-containing alcohol dehydrogenase [Vibrio methylphosphonaticus]